jgi:cytochrome bd ubiquinol oxidase subunit II
MTYVALGIPFVLAYIAYVWMKMDAKKLAAHEVMDHEVY